MDYLEDVSRINQFRDIMNTDKVTKQEFEEIIDLLNERYHNGQSLIVDAEYEEIKNLYESLYGQKYEKVGHEPRGEKSKLPYYLSSLNKITDPHKMDLWLKNYEGDFLIQDKLDGLSLLYYNNDKCSKLFTRGNGNVGQDVSHLLPFLNLPKTSHTVRGEIIITKETFEKYKDTYKNERNMTSGIVNSQKSFNENLAKELSFYAYRILDETNTASEDMEKLQALGFTIPELSIMKNKITHEDMESLLIKRNKNSSYIIDGLVIYKNISVNYPTDSNPKHITAFKIEGRSVETIVTDVVWEGSMSGLLKPVVYYEPVEYNGCEMRKASGYNARFIEAHKINKGSVILVTRSGDVIPKITDVITHSKESSKPVVQGGYHWNENGVEYVLNVSNNSVIINKFKYFLDTIGVKNIGRKRLKTIVESDVTKIDQLIRLTANDLLKLPGFASGLSISLVNAIKEKLNNIDFASLLVCSGLFLGIGIKRFRTIVAKYPKIHEMDPGDIEEKVKSLRGFNKLSKVIADNMPRFCKWFERNKKFITIKEGDEPAMEKETTGHPLEGKTIVFSGFRDEKFSGLISEHGGKVTSAVSNRTDILIQEGTRLTKYDKAESLGKEILSLEEFKQKYLGE